MKQTTLVLTTLVAALLALPGIAVAGGGNDEQTGTSVHCLEYNVLYLVGANTDGIAVDPGTEFVATSDADFMYIDFDSGEYFGGAGEVTGTVPSGATAAAICTTVVDNYPAVPVPGDWTYQDGL